MGRLMICTIAVSTTLLMNAAAQAKGHDQGNGNGVGAGQDGTPGSLAVAETASAAKTLGPAKGASSTAPGKTK